MVPIEAYFCILFDKTLAWRLQPRDLEKPNSSGSGEVMTQILSHLVAAEQQAAELLQVGVGEPRLVRAAHAQRKVTRGEMGGGRWVLLRIDKARLTSSSSDEYCPQLRSDFIS